MTAPQTTPELPAEMLLTDAEQLRAVSDPLRLELLDIMGGAPVRTWTAKELAERLGTKQTKLYHHLGVLEDRGFIDVAETRVVSGILEKRYRVRALSFRVDRTLLAGSGGEAVGPVLDAIFEKARIEIVEGQRAGLLDLSAEEFERRRMALWASHARLSPASVRKVMRLIERLGAIDDLDQPDGSDYGLVIAFYPRATDRDADR
jgi:DNA-binding transcriptional ArsR family regulator